ncbi:uncharacterized protein LOC132713756 [Ruditapes philippinarum]|uniref:uncharacterized protein LOC132713756 n=1 Tax=Ruditapes philippinarum TaxID=129788 RepID=UPI00295BE7AF|nr:uncharacterized protein LOC132713756 [Ruditapes philippinarum]
MQKRLAFVVVFLHHLLVVVTSYKCLQCDDVPLPNLCEEVGECGEHEFCAIKQYVNAAGSFRYQLSCRDKKQCGTRQSVIGKRNDFLACSECCQGDLCNVAGCGQKGFDPVYGPLCYVCPLQLGSNTCGKVQQCGRDKVCSIQPVSRVGAPDNLFETKCVERNDRMCGAHDEIDSSMIVGRKRSSCSVCCNSTMCNDYDSRPCVPSSTTAKPMSLTSPIVNTIMSTSSSSSSPPSTKMSTVMETSRYTLPTTKTATTTKAAHGFTTAPVTQEVCEDKAKCYVIACNISKHEYIEVNCRKTCNLCGTPQATTPAKTTPKPTSPSTITTTSRPSTTSTTGVSGHTHSLFCHDIAVGCNTTLNYCIIPEYKGWTLTNCRKTCNYC